MAKQYKKHSDVPKKYQWDLSTILEGKELKYWTDKYFDLFEKIIKHKTKAYDSKASYIKFLDLQEEQEMVMYKVINYLQLQIKINAVDAKVKAQLEELSYKAYLMEQKLGPTKPDFFKNAKKIQTWIKDKEFDGRRFWIKAALEEKSRQLPKAIQEYRTKASRGNISAREVFSIMTAAELDYGFVTDSKGKKFKLNPANRIKYIESNDKSLRRTAFTSYAKAYIDHKQSLSNLLHQHLKEASVEAKLHKFNSSIEAAIHEDRFPEKTLLTLYKSVQDNTKVFKKYKSYYKKFYEAQFKEKYNPKYDAFRKLVKTDSKYTVEQAQKLVIDVVKPLGKEYTDQIKEAFKTNWIDYMSVANKHTGAFSIGGTYGLDKKYILMNFKDNFESVSTLAHELGHSMHSYFADKHNSLSESQYPIFLAEIASLFNEIMLKDYLMENESSDKMKFQILSNSITTFSGTVLRQTEWSNYEYDLMKAIDEGKPVSTYEALSKIYFDNADKYTVTGKPVKRTDDLGMNAFRVPHFFAGFYVYKYAIGYLCANIFFQKYKTEGKKALDDYINKFLSAGASNWPMEILKDAGIDLNDENVYKLAFKQVEQEISQWINLGKKIFKVK